MLYISNKCVLLYLRLFFFLLKGYIALRVFIGGDSRRYYYLHSVDGAYPPSGSRSIST